MCKFFRNFAAEMNKNTAIFVFLVLLTALLFVGDLCVGAADVGLQDLWTDGLAHRIMWSLRLPKALTAVLAGVGLSVSGLLLQTLFRNPLAGPSVLGISSGATLGVATLVLCGTLLGFMPTYGGTILCAVAGAMLVLLLVLLVSFRINGVVTLLIVGMMIGSIGGALVNVMQNMADPDSLKLYVTWTLGTLASVGWGEMPWLVGTWLVGMLLAIGLIKPLNGLLLGEDYAASLGVNVRSVRTMLVVATGLLAGAVTAFCGPIAFVGVAVPHVARGWLGTANHRLTLPASALIGAVLLLVCDMLSSACTYPLPISTISALFGAPVVIWVVMRPTQSPCLGRKEKRGKMDEK